MSEKNKIAPEEKAYFKLYKKIIALYLGIDSPDKVYSSDIKAKLGK